MPIRRFLERNPVFGPEDIARLISAFEGALAALKLTDRDDPATLLVAERIIALAKDGERDPQKLQEIVVKSFSR